MVFIVLASQSGESASWAAEMVARASIAPAVAGTMVPGSVCGVLVSLRTDILKKSGSALFTV